MIEKPPILVTGIARSGTSMVAGIINICGAFGGELVGSNLHNQKGMFENSHIREKIVKPYLREINADPLGQNPLPDTDRIPIPNDWQQRIEAVMEEHGYKEGAWFYKEAKMSLMWPVWNYAFPNAKWVIVRRRSPDIVDSCMRTSFMRAFTDREGWFKWIREHERRFSQMYEAGLNIHVIWPERIIHGDYTQMYQLIDWLGLEYKPQEIANFIEPKLWKARKKQKLIQW
jgi:hypothetical protein